MHPRKRWMCRAERNGGGWVLHAPEPVGDVVCLPGRLAEGVSGAILGVDFPIGLPARYAGLAGIESFTDFLPLFGGGRWSRFYEPARSGDEIGLARPFYPMAARRKGEASMTLLLDGLGLEPGGLRRRCDGPTLRRPAACPLFWTVGANQVGKGAIAGWRELVAPARERHGAGIWPFDGSLSRLLAERPLTIAETYPGECYGMAGIDFRSRRASKRRQDDRARQAPAILGFAENLGLALSPPLTEAVRDGFGSAADGEDRFDSLAGLLGMLSVIEGRPSGEPEETTIRRVEGWILGLNARDLRE